MNAQTERLTLTGPAGAIEAHAGKWALELAKPITLALAVEGQSLVGTLSSDTEARFTFVPHAPGQFHALERDFQLKFAPDGRTLAYRAMARPGLVGMAVGDQRACDRAQRVDVEIALGAIQPGLGRQKDRIGAHEPKM